eukprot:m.108703 g.108703  ORF g.108703 m.108703 type:complete len:205 (-) comp15217_c1_seq1:1609-2223(-)
MVNSFFSLFLLFISIDHLLSGIFLDVMRTCGRLFLGFRLVQHSSLPPQAGKNFGHHNNERIRLVKFHLRQELPQIIAKSPSETLNLCHPDLIFKDNIHGFTLHGRNAFKLALLAFRQTIPLWVSQPTCQVLWLDQRAPQELHSRWRIVGFSNTSLSGQIWLDAYTIFHVRNTGMIEMIELDNVMPNKDKLKPAKDVPLFYNSSA